MHMKTAECQTDFPDVEYGHGHHTRDESHPEDEKHEKKKKKKRHHSKSPKDSSDSDEKPNGKE